VLVHRCSAWVTGERLDAVQATLAKLRTEGVEIGARELPERAVVIAAWHPSKPAARAADRDVVERVAKAVAPAPTRGRRARPPKENQLLHRALRGDLQNAALACGFFRVASARARDPEFALRLWTAWLDSARADLFLRDRLVALGGSADPDLAGAEGYGALYGSAVSRLGRRVLHTAARSIVNLAAEGAAIRAEIFHERGESRAARRFEAMVEAARRSADSFR
jgi:hypothetical protein